MARRLILLFAALLTLLTGAPATALAGAPAHTATGAQNCARAFLSAAPNHAPVNRQGSPCTRPGSVFGSARIAAGCCVATKGPARQIGPAGDAAAQGLSRVDRFRALQRDGIQVGEQRFGINAHVINSVRKSGRRHVTPEDLIDALRQPAGPARSGSRSYTNPQTGSRFFVNDADDVVGVHPKGFK